MPESDAKTPPASHKPEVNTSLNIQDPFESAVWDIVKINRKKRRDYACDGEWDTNFRDSAAQVGLDIWESAEFMVAQKLSRLKSLRANGRMDSPANESVADTYLDAAVYAVIMYALYDTYCGDEG